MTQIYDLSDPAKPVFIRDFGLPGQQPGSTGPVPTELHGPISTGPKGNRVYFGYGTGAQRHRADRRSQEAAERAEGADRREPVVPADRQTRSAAGRRRAHGVSAARACSCRSSPSRSSGPGTAAAAGVDARSRRRRAADRTQARRDFIAVVGETTANECLENRQMVRMRRHHRRVEAVRRLDRGRCPKSSGNFCERGGRFGTHSSNENMTPIYYNRVLFLAHFNAGVRALDVRDPFNPKEIGYLHPGGHRQDRQALRRHGRRRALQGRDPDQQRRGRRPRLHLHRRSREHRHAHPRAHRRRAQSGELPITAITKARCHEEHDAM